MLVKLNTLKYAFVYSMQHILIQLVKHVTSFLSLILSLLPVSSSWAELKPVPVPFGNFYFSRVIFTREIVIVRIATPI